MKKRLAAILAAAMVLTVAGCGDQGDSGDSGNAGNAGNTDTNTVASEKTDDANGADDTQQPSAGAASGIGAKMGGGPFLTAQAERQTCLSAE